MRNTRNKRRLPTRNGKPTHSPFPGVTFEHRKKPWTATITTGGKRKHLGRLLLEADAAQAYVDALPKYPL